MVVAVQVEQATSGRLLGRGGETVKRMREQSNAFIDIQNSIRGATKRVVTIKGAPDCIVTALGLVADSTDSPHTIGRFGDF
jgi:hypothetical protein